MMNAMRRCEQCGKDASDQPLVRVGNEVLCPTCLIGVCAVAEAPLEGVVHCLVCETPLEPHRSVVFFARRICSACVAQMNRELEVDQTGHVAPGEPDERSESSELGAFGEAASEPLTESQRTPSDAQLFTPGAQTAKCDGCERPMPGPGSYRVLQGRRYCAACWPFYSARAGAGSSAPPGALEPAQRCACCDSAPLEAPVELEGFLLCRECVRSDVRLALAVAAARRRRRSQARDDSQKEHRDE